MCLVVMDFWSRSLLLHPGRVVRDRDGLRAVKLEDLEQFVRALLDHVPGQAAQQAEVAQDLAAG